MNGVHDLGGMDGFGPIARDSDGYDAHGGWELRMHCVCFAARAERLFNLDEFRHAIERMPPAEYLTSAYYERWLAAVGRLLVEKGVLRADELAARAEAYAADPQAAVPRREAPDRTARAFAWQTRKRSPRTADEPDQAPRFRPGERVRVRTMHPQGHTRAPRYVRDKEGVISEHYGSQILPDVHAQTGEKVLEPLYAVRFAAREVWGEDYAHADAVYVDLWESYLEPTGV